MLGPPIPTDRTSSLELVRITEAAAISAAHWMGHGDNNRADEAAVEAMRKAMDEVAFNGTVVFGGGTPTGVVPDLAGPVCRIELDLGLGTGEASYLASDLSYDYVRINAEYTT